MPENNAKGGSMPSTSADRGYLDALEARLIELERAVGILAGEQLNQSGERPALMVVLRRYRSEPKPAEREAVNA